MGRDLAMALALPNFGARNVNFALQRGAMGNMAAVSSILIAQPGARLCYFPDRRM